MNSSLRGHLLVASPALLDPNFARTVVLIAEHGEDGALGVVLNRPSEAAVVATVPALADLVVDDDEPIYFGGPVQPSGVLLLAEFEQLDDSARIIFEDIGFLVAGVEEDEQRPETRRVRVFAGHSGWGPGQLEAEIEREDWIIETAQREDVFGLDPGEELWGRVLERKGGQFSLLARMPADPSMN